MIHPQVLNSFVLDMLFGNKTNVIVYNSSLQRDEIFNSVRNASSIFHGQYIARRDSGDFHGVYGGCLIVTDDPSGFEFHGAYICG